MTSPATPPSKASFFKVSPLVRLYSTTIAGRATVLARPHCDQADKALCYSVSRRGVTFIVTCRLARNRRSLLIVEESVREYEALRG